MSPAGNGGRRAEFSEPDRGSATRSAPPKPSWSAAGSAAPRRFRSHTPLENPISPGRKQSGVAAALGHRSPKSLRAEPRLGTETIRAPPSRTAGLRPAAQRQTRCARDNAKARVNPRAAAHRAALRWRAEVVRRSFPNRTAGLRPAAQNMTRGAGMIF